MPTLKTPLVGSFNIRGFGVSQALDQVFKNCVFTRPINQATNSATWYVEKRPGLDTALNVGSLVRSTFVYTSPSLSSALASPAHVSAFGNSLSTIYYTNTSAGVTTCGVMTGLCYSIIEELLGGITYFMLGCTDGTGWFLASDSLTPLTFTGTSHTSTLIDGITSTAGMYIGQLVTGSGVQAGSRIATVASAVSITLTLATTTSTTATFTREAIAKIIDVDFPVTLAATANSAQASGVFAEMDGFVFTVTSDAKVYNSDLNSVSSWSASSFIAANISTDKATGVFKHKNQIAVAGNGSWEFFYNAGNATGSILSSSPPTSSKIGAPFAGCITQAGDKLWFIGPDRGLWKMEGFAPTKIVAEGNPLGGPLAYGPNSAFASMSACYISGQLAIYIYSAPGYDRMYFPEVNMWMQPSFLNGSVGGLHFGGDFGFPLAVADGNNTGKSYFWGAATVPVFTDDGTAYTMSIQIATDMGTNKRKFATELRVEADVQPSGSLAVSYSDNDGASFSTPVNMPLTSIAAMKLTRLGSWKGTRLWKFEHNANTAFRAKMIEIDYEVAA